MELTQEHFDEVMGIVLNKLSTGVALIIPGQVQLPPEGTPMTWIEAFNLTKDNPKATFETDTEVGMFIFKGHNPTPLGDQVWTIGKRPIKGLGNSKLPE